MGVATIFRPLKIAVAFAALSSFIFTSVGAAQTDTSSAGSSSPTIAQAQPASTGPFVLSLQTPVSGARIGGNVTFTGAAVDCGRGVAATRVAFYDGDRSGTYLADASIDTNRALARYCNSQSGSAQVGFTLVTNTRQWRDGQHTLTMVAEFPGGGSTSTSVDVIVDNFAPRYDRYDPWYGPGGYNYGYNGYGYNGYGYNGYGYNGYGYGNNSYYSGYYGSGSGLCNGYANNWYTGYYNGCGSSPYSITSCTWYNCGGYAGYSYNYGRGYCGSYYSIGNCGYYSAYAYPYANVNYGVYVTGPGYNAGNCAYYFVSYTGCGGYGTGYNYGQSYITLNQAGQTVRLAGPVVLSGFATCSGGIVSSVTLTDRTGNGNVVIGTAPASGSYSINWVPTGLGAKVIQVTATGTCGTFSQSFSVNVIP